MAQRAGTIGFFKIYTEARGPLELQERQPSAYLAPNMITHATTNSIPINPLRGNIWELPVLRYHRFRVNHPYPLLGVILMVILHYFIIKITIKKVQLLPFPLFMVSCHILF